MIEMQRITRQFTDVFKYRVHLEIPGFEKNVKPGLFQYSLRDITSQEWFLEFANRIDKAIGRVYLPIYRMSDGEFMFMVGHKTYVGNGNNWWTSVLTRLLKKARHLRGMRTMWGEHYSTRERKTLLDDYARYLKRIAENGVLAIHFTYDSTIVESGKRPFADQYYPHVLNWLLDKGIPLDSSNYYPFYFVYALSNGPARSIVYRGRRVLVVTHHTDEKARLLNSSLEREGVTSVQFLQISANRAMVDKLDLSLVRHPIDVVLIGAGIGAANILFQLEQLGTVCIDAGFCLECLADPSLRIKRPWCLPDSDATW